MSNTFETEWVVDGLKVRTLSESGEWQYTMTYDPEFVKAVQKAGPPPRKPLKEGEHFFSLHAFTLPVGLILRGDDGWEYVVAEKGRGGRWQSVDGPPRAEVSYDPDAISGTIVYVPSTFPGGTE